MHARPLWFVCLTCPVFGGHGRAERRDRERREQRRLQAVVRHAATVQRHPTNYRCTFGPGLVGRPEARKKKHGPGTARPEII
jgi:hypothetical protein